MRCSRFLAVGALAVVLAGCTPDVGSTPHTTSQSSTPHSGSNSPAPIGARASFHDCSSLLEVKGVTIASALTGKLTATCAAVPVPLDYAHPDGDRAQLTLVRIHDRDNSGSTPLLVNPGGPGGSGVESALGLLDKLPTELAEHYDIVGFDPRGVALSTPAIECLSDSEQDQLSAASPDITTSAGFTAGKTLWEQYAGDCTAHTKDLADYNTVNTAKDIDILRRALGQRETDYLGFSYGTELGSVYAHLFPQRVGAMVLDGAIDPLTSGITQSTAQLAGFEQAYGQFAAYCRRTSPCSGLGDPVAAAVQVERTAGAHPLPTSTGRTLTSSLASTGIQEALYARKDWHKLGAALAHAQAGDGTDLLSLADDYNQRGRSGHYTNLQDAFNVISCNDSAPGPTDSAIRETARSWSTKYPVFGASFAGGLFTCQAWQPDRTVPPKPTADTEHPVLVVGNLHDPATPYQGAVDLAKTMGNAEVLAWDGEGHTSFLNGSDCVDRYVTSYLVSQQLPPHDTTCPA